jgi:hypothetical protein
VPQLPSMPLPNVQMFQTFQMFRASWVFSLLTPM